MDQYYARRRRNENDDPVLLRDRRANDDKLKSRFEHIFEKYERDFTGIGDEIDLETGEIVVNNGHLISMRHEVDPGDGTSVELMRAFAEDLKEESAEPTSEEDATSVETVEDGGDDDSEGRGAEDKEATPDVVEVSSGSDDTKSSSGYTSSGVLTDEGADSDLDELSSDHYVCLRQTSAKSLEGSSFVHSESGQTSSSGHDTSRSDSPSADFDFDSIPGVRESIQALQAGINGGSTPGPDAIQALSLNIAKQMTELMAKGPIEPAKNKLAKSKVRQSAWEYPELPIDSRPRTPSPAPRPILSTSAALFTHSPLAEESIWAPVRHPHPRKKRRVNPPANAILQDDDTGHGTVGLTLPEGLDLEQATNGGEQEDVGPEIRDAPTKVCTYCAKTKTPTWRKGPDGDLCNACGMYFYRYGNLRSAPGSEIDSEEADLESEFPSTGGGDIGADMGPYPANVGRRVAHYQSFSVEEDAMIIVLKEVDDLSWETIGRRVGGRGAPAVQSRYSKKLWNHQSEARLRLVAQGYSFPPGGPAMAPSGTVSSHLAPEFVPFRVIPQENSVSKSNPDMWLSYYTDSADWQGPGRARIRKLQGNVNPGLDDGPPQRRFSPGESASMKYLREVDKLSWQDIATHLPGRTASSVQKHYNRELSGTRTSDGDMGYFGLDPLANPENARFTRDEDELILKLKDDEDWSWEQISDHLSGRTVSSLMSRYRFIKDMSSFQRSPHSYSTDGANLDYPEKLDHPIEASRADGDEMNGPVRRSSCPPTDLGSLHVQSYRFRASSLPPASREQSLEASTPHDSFIQSALTASEKVRQMRMASQTQAPTPIDSPSDLYTFTEVEDKLIKRLREKERLNWLDIAARVPGPSANSVANRYYTRLLGRKLGGSSGGKKEQRVSPTGDPSPGPGKLRYRKRYTREEHDRIFTLREQGVTWANIAKQLPGRSAASVQAYYSDARKKGLSFTGLDPDLETLLPGLTAQSQIDGLAVDQALPGSRSSSEMQPAATDMRDEIGLAEVDQFDDGDAYNNTLMPELGTQFHDPRLTTVHAPSEQLQREMETQEESDTLFVGDNEGQAVSSPPHEQNGMLSDYKDPIPHNQFSSPERSPPLAHGMAYETPSRFANSNMPYFVAPPLSVIKDEPVQSQEQQDGEDPLVLSSEEQTTTEGPMRLSGRLKRTRLDSTLDEEETEAADQSNSDGRPSEERTVTAKPVRRPGRPRKIRPDTAVEEEEISANDSSKPAALSPEEQTATVRRSGRQKKPKMFPTDEGEETAITDLRESLSLPSQVRDKKPPAKRVPRKPKAREPSPEESEIETPGEEESDDNSLVLESDRDSDNADHMSMSGDEDILSDPIDPVEQPAKGTPTIKHGRVDKTPAKATPALKRGRVTKTPITLAGKLRADLGSSVRRNSSLSGSIRGSPSLAVQKSGTPKSMLQGKRVIVVAADDGGSEDELA